MVRKLVILIVIIVASFVLSSKPIFAHPGRTASDGCHYCRTNCSSWGVAWNERHCHGGSIIPPPSITTSPPPPDPEPAPEPVPEPVSIFEQQKQIEPELILQSEVLGEETTELEELETAAPPFHIDGPSPDNYSDDSAAEGSVALVLIILAAIGGGIYWFVLLRRK